MITMITAYLDESGHSNDTRLVCMAGAVAPMEFWIELEPEWKRALDHYEIKEWHTAPFAKRVGEFRKWKNNDTVWEDAYRTFMGIIQTSRVMPVGATVSMTGWNECNLNERFHDPYYLCLQVCVREALKFAARVQDPDGRLRVVFDNTEEFKSRVPQLYDAIRSTPFYALPWAKRLMEEPLFQSAKTLVQLQAADLIAYQVAVFGLVKTGYQPLTPEWGYDYLLETVASSAGFFDAFTVFDDEQLRLLSRSINRMQKGRE